MDPSDSCCAARHPMARTTPEPASSEKSATPILQSIGVAMWTASAGSSPLQSTAAGGAERHPGDGQLQPARPSVLTVRRVRAVRAVPLHPSGRLVVLIA